MMYRFKDWFIHLLILSTIYEHNKQFKIEESKQNETFTVLAELNVAQKKSRMTYRFYCLLYSIICQLYNLKKL